MKKLCLALMLLSSFTNASAQDNNEVTIDNEITLSMLGGGSIVAIISLTPLLLLDVPEAVVPVLAGGLVLGAGLAVTGFMKASVAGFVRYGVGNKKAVTQ